MCDDDSCGGWSSAAGADMSQHICFFSVVALKTVFKWDTYDDTKKHFMFFFVLTLDTDLIYK